MSRTNKRPYTGSKQFDRTCRSHGDCPWCQNNRRYAQRKADEAYKDQLEELTMSDELDAEYRRGFRNAFACVNEVLTEVEIHLQDDNGNVGETSRAVLGFIRKALGDHELGVYDFWEATDRREDDLR